MTNKEFPITIKKQTWKQAVSKVGNTPTNYDIWKVGNQYQAPKPGKYNLVLVNGLESWDEAIKYAKDNKLSLTSPYQVFALDIDFQKELNSYGWVVATKDYAFEGRAQACFVWWGGSGRWAALDWTSSFGLADDWFAFSRESLDFGKLGTSLEARVLELEKFKEKVEGILKV